MAVATIDTHEVVKELKAAGFSDDQAEAVTRVVRRAQDIDVSNLATKPDLAALKTDLAALKADMATKTDLAALKADMATKTDLAALKADMATKTDLAAMASKLDLAELKAEMLKWMVGTIGLQTVVILGAVIGLVKLLH